MVERFVKFARHYSDLNFWWDDQKDIHDRLSDDMAYGVQNSCVVVVFVSDAYFASNSSAQEVNYADTLRKEMIIVKMRKGFEVLGRGSIGLIASSKSNVSSFNKHI